MSHFLTLSRKFHFIFYNIASSIKKRPTGPNGHLSVMYNERGVDEPQTTCSTCLSTNLTTLQKNIWFRGGDLNHFQYNFQIV